MSDNLWRADYIFGEGLEYDPEGEYCRYDEAAEVIERKNALLREAATENLRLAGHLESGNVHRTDAAFFLRQFAARIRKEIGDCE